MSLLEIAVAILLFIVSALLVSAETAFGRVSRSRIDDLRREDNPRAARVLTILDDRPRYVNVLFFLSTVSTITAIVLFGRTVITDFIRDGMVPWLAYVITIVILVLIAYVGLGVAPRTLGRQHAERISLVAARPTILLTRILSPLATLLIYLGNALTPGKGFRQGPFDSEAELRELVDMAGENSLIEDDERQMIHSVFELGDTFAREVMVPRTDMVFIERSKTLRQAMSLGLRSGYSRIPVIRESADDIVGVIYLKDIVKRTFEHRDAENTELVDSLMRAPYFVPDSKRADDLLRDMQSARVHMAIVIDEYGGTAGIVTIEDILEEIVGEIADEYDTAAPEVTELADGAYRVMSRMNIDDFADLIGIDIDSEEEGVDTVLGLMAKRLGRVPIAGADVTEDGWVLIAERGSGRRNRISTVLARPVRTTDEDVDD
ncbi:MAG: hemolysin family protein [Actinomycetota bacterium]